MKACEFEVAALPAPCYAVLCPHPLSIDWDNLKTLYLKGLTLPEIAREAAVSYSALPTHAHRYGWKANAQKLAQRCNGLSH